MDCSSPCPGSFSIVFILDLRQVMSSTHALNGQELAIDRATPKDKGPPGQTQLAARLAVHQQTSAHRAAGRGCLSSPHSALNTRPPLNRKLPLALKPHS